MLEKLIEMAISGVVGNFSYDKVKKFLSSSSDENTATVKEIDKSSIEQDPDIESIHGPNIYYKRNYLTFDIQNDLEDVISLMREPVVHIVLEDKPSTAWHQALVVAEDKITSEWYVFSKGRLAFEGSGGGLSQSKALFKKLLDKNIPFTAWVIDQISSEKLSHGCRLWPEMRDKCVPILAFEKSDYFKKYVLGVFSEISKP